jgi:hypothetical protein
VGIENDPTKALISEEPIKYLFHSFYNDLNVKIEEFEKDGVNYVRLFKSNQINSGLNILFGDNNSLELSKEDFIKYSKDLIALKYDVLKAIANRDSTLIPSGNPILYTFLGKGYVAGKVKTDLVLVKTTYYEDFNNPFEKFGDIESKHLQNGDVFTNVYLKISKGKTSYYLHLATAPKIETLKEYFNKNEAIQKRFPN